MADPSKTEKATPKKRRDERKKGNVFQSKDAITVTTLIVTFSILFIFADSMLEQIDQIFYLCFSYAAELGIGKVPTVIDSIVREGILLLLKTAGLIMVFGVAATVVATFAQTKMLVTAESLKPKFNRISPIEGFKRLFSMRSVVDALKGILKISILLYIVYRYVTGMTNSFFNYLYMDLGLACSDLFQHTFSMILQIVLAFIVLAAFDFYYQWWEYERKMRMSKQEIKDEYKQIEGDPKIKAKIKETQRRMAMSRMMQQVPGADVVIRNPEHVAVALRYKPDRDNAPIVLAKGLDELALRIVSVAEAHKVSVVENIPLARSLYASTDLNREIPSDLYGAVADVLVYLYRMKNKEPQ